jgi:hypothetical protein
MKATKHEIDKLEDTRVLVLSRAQGPFGEMTARQHANLLMMRGMKAFATADFESAITICTRELDFNTKAFGAEHPYTIASKNCLAALKRFLARAERNLSSTAVQQQKDQMAKAVNRVFVQAKA